MNHSSSSNARPSTPEQTQPAPQQATAGLSKQAFREMLAAAERVNRHHTQHLSRRAS